MEKIKFWIKEKFFIIICLTPELLPVLGPLTRWRASTKIAAILDRGNFFRRNCRDLKMNRSIAAAAPIAAPIAAPDRDLHMNIRSLNKTSFKRLHKVLF